MRWWSFVCIRGLKKVEVVPFFCWMWWAWEAGGGEGGGRGCGTAGLGIIAFSVWYPSTGKD